MQSLPAESPLSPRRDHFRPGRVGGIAEWFAPDRDGRGKFGRFRRMGHETVLPGGRRSGNQQGMADPGIGDGSCPTTGELWGFRLFADGLPQPPKPVRAATEGAAPVPEIRRDRLIFGVRPAHFPNRNRTRTEFDFMPRLV